VAYLAIIIVVALAGITRITLQQRREHKLHVQNDFRTSLEKVATQPLARPDDGPRRRWELAGWTDRKKARDEKVVAEKQTPRERETRRRERPPRKTTERREATRRNGRKPAADQSAGRSRTRPMHRGRPVTSRHENVDWFEDLRSQPSDISLDHDLAPTKLPVNTRRAGQPSARGRLQPEFHANIHPAHLPPHAEDLEIDLRSSRTHTENDPELLWEEFANGAVPAGYRKRALSRRRAG
jgi:hypothetical protein